MFASRKNKSTQQTNLNQSTSTAPTMAFKLNSSIGTNVDQKQMRSFHSPRILGVSNMSGGPTGSVNLQSPDFNSSQLGANQRISMKHTMDESNLAENSRLPSVNEIT